MDVIELAKRLIAIPSVTGEEGEIGEYLTHWLEQESFQVERQEFEPGRANIFASSGEPVEVVFCTHLDTVPPILPIGEDDDFVYGRGACDAKGPLAAMLAAGRSLKSEGFFRFGFLFVVGEETDSRGAKAAESLNPGSRFILIGEPTGNKLAAGHQGVLNFRLTTRGRAAHSAFPHLGESAVDRLLDVLQSIRLLDLGTDPILEKSSLNIGLIEGGTAANVIAPRAEASILIRCAIPAREILDRVRSVIDGRAALEILSETDPLRFSLRSGYETTTLPFGTDAPYLGAFGRRFLLGPGSPEDAHTDHERIGKRGLEEAVRLYRRLVRELTAEPATENDR
jgi:acetylornithine deacetylase